MPRPAKPRGVRLVTLTSDVGSAYAAQMKAALIAGGVPPDRLVELAHDLPAHGVREAAFVLRAMARGFPSSAVHLVVVDPGVGGRRRAIVIETRSGPLLVGPDNGVLVPLAEELGIRATYHLVRSIVARVPAVGTTFDGRDLFAPAAALLATGTRASALGPRTEPTPLVLPPAARTAVGARGEVLHVDRFGNVITNIPSRWLGRGVRELDLTIGKFRRRRVRFSTSYESLGAGALGALASSFGLLEVAVREGRAADTLGACVGSPLELAWRRRSPPRGEKANSARPRKLG